MITEDSLFCFAVLHDHFTTHEGLKVLEKGQSVGARLMNWLCALRENKSGTIWRFNISLTKSRRNTSTSEMLVFLSEVSSDRTTLFTGERLYLSSTHAVEQQYTRELVTAILCLKVAKHATCRNHKFEDSMDELVIHWKPCYLPLSL